MAIEAKYVRIYISRILMLLMENACLIIQRHPYVSGALSLFFLMYWFLPFVFNLLVYSIPVILCAAVLVTVLFCSENLHIHNFKNFGKKEQKFPSIKSESSENVVIKKYTKPRIEPQMSKRRNFKMHDIKEITQANATSRLNDMFICGISHDKEDAAKVIETNKGYLQNEDGEETPLVSETPDNECFLDSDVKPLNDETSLQGALDDDYNDGNKISLEVDTLEEAADEDEEEAQEDRNQAVEWTEDDQKNVMDLGFSEIERNRRLENLIAKRRARKFLSMKLQENHSDTNVGHHGYVPPVHIAKTNPFDIPFQYEENLDSQAPGSAPSIMLPSRNPFDLPYDPHEEKPNLSVYDSNQELLGVVPKDIFCRHESFSLGPSFSAATTDHKGPMNMHPYPVMDRKGMTQTGYSRFRTQSEKGDHDKLVEGIVYHKSLSEGHEDIAYINWEQESIGKAPELISSSQGNDVQEHNESNNLITSKGDGVEPTESSSIDSLVSEANSKSDLTEEDNNNEPMSSSSPQDHNMTVYATKSKCTASSDDRMNELHELSKIPVRESFPDVVPNSTIMREPVYDSSPSAVDSLLKGIAHSSMHSIASDMHVEVSEAGSSHNTMDGLTSPSEVESSTYEVDVEGKVNPVDDEIWQASSYERVIEGNESRSEEISDNAEAKSFEKYDSFNYPTESLRSLPEIIGQDSVDGLSTSSSTVPTDIEMHQPESADDLSDDNEFKGSKNDSPVSSNGPHFEDSINLMDGVRENNDGESSPTKLEEITESAVTSTEQSYSMNGLTNDVVQEQENQLTKEKLELSFEHEFNVKLEGIREKAAHGSPSKTEFIKEQETQHIAEKKEDKPKASIRDQVEIRVKKVGKDGPISLEEGENESREQMNHEVTNCLEKPTEIYINSNIPQHVEAPIRDEEEIELKAVVEDNRLRSLKEGKNELREQMDHVVIDCSERSEEVQINLDIPQHIEGSIRDEEEREHKELGEESSSGSSKEGENNSGKRIDEAINCSKKLEDMHISPDIPQHMKGSIRDDKEMEHKEVGEGSSLGSLKEGENNSREQMDHEAVNCSEKLEEVHINPNIPQHVEGSIRDEKEMEQKEVRGESSSGSSKEGENNSREQMDHEAINCSEKPQEVHMNSGIPQHVEASIRDEKEMEHKEVGEGSIPRSLEEGQNETMKQTDHEVIKYSEKPEAEEVHINTEIPQHVESN